MTESYSPLPWTGDGFEEHDERIHYYIKFAKQQNFGDYLPELFCKSMLLAPKVDVDIYRLVGSVIDENWIRRNFIAKLGTPNGRVAFWGCGLRNETPLSDAMKDKCLFFGVRGPRSRDVLGLPKTTVLGDPGLLCPLIHPPTIGAGSSGRTLCVPHIYDPKSLADLHAQSGCDDIASPEISSSEADLRGIIDKIIASSFVLAGSLHSAIIAFAYDRPFAFWNSGHIDVPFKWDDFSHSVGLQTIFVKTLAEGQEVYAKQIAPFRRPLPLAPILANCPFQARPEILIRALEYDGVLSQSAADATIAQLVKLPDNDPGTMRNLYAISRETRKRRESVSLNIQGASVRSAISLKRLLRAQIGKLVSRSSA